jgi:hypothetical protein
MGCRVKTFKQSEADFTSMVIELARRLRWRVLHVRPARVNKGWRTAVEGDGVGWPDLLCVRHSRIIVAELKRESGGVLSSAQEAWLLAFQLTEKVEVYVWRPEDWDDIVRILTEPTI